jgi:trk system potassium uptake protein TrkH
MNINLTLRILGALLLFLAIALLFPVPFSWIYGDGASGAFILSAIISAGCGGILFSQFNSEKDLSVREGFAIVTFGWTFFALFGALPFVFSGAIPSYLNAFFETMSGFTTTGSTILTGMQLFKAEVPGPTTDRLKPRIQDTAKLLWGVYVLLTCIEILLLMAGGMSFFDGLNHAFTTMATGGFSTRNASVAAYNSAYIDWIITIFMFLAGVNFSLHYLALRGKVVDFIRNEEFLFYSSLVIVGTALITMLNMGGTYPGFLDNLRYSAFQVVSIITTTGFGTADYELWPVLCQYLLVFFMFIGGCAGSTGGGMKVA